MSLLSDLNRVHVQSSVFITEFENVIVSCIMMVFIFSLALKQMLEAVCTMQATVLMTVSNSKKL